MERLHVDIKAVIDKRRKKLHQWNALTFLCVGTLAVFSIFVHTSLKGKWAKNEISEKMKVSTGQQVEKLIPSFLLPEESGGAKLL